MEVIELMYCIKKYNLVWLIVNEQMYNQKLKYISSVNDTMVHSAHLYYHRAKKTFKRLNGSSLYWTEVWSGSSSTVITTPTTYTINYNNSTYVNPETYRNYISVLGRYTPAEILPQE